MSTEEEFDAAPFIRESEQEWAQRAAPRLVLEADDGPPSVTVYYVAMSNVSLDAGHTLENAEMDRVVLMEVYQQFVVIYPINIRRDKEDYLKQKYPDIKSIGFDWNDATLPETADDVREMLEQFPAGFSKQYQYGLGLKWEYRFLIEAISKIEEVSHISFSKTEKSGVDGDVYTFNLRGYEALRKFMDSLTRRYQKEAHSDKRLLCYTNILHEHDPEKYPLKLKDFKSSGLYNSRAVSEKDVKLEKKDRKIALELVTGNKEELANDAPHALLKLKTDIEQVTLGRLIAAFEHMLSMRLNEGQWQKFFKDNSFILSLAFSYPVMLIQDQAHVGGADIRGVGVKIADFLVANRFTGNLAIFEIKKPDVSLLAEVEYRKNLYRSSKELSGAIAQVQDQKFQIQNNFVTLAYQSGWEDVHPFSAHCIVVIGRNVTDRHERKSFEFTRHALKDVHIITFDELLEKMKELHKIFSADKSFLNDDIPF